MNVYNIMSDLESYLDPLYALDLGYKPTYYDQYSLQVSWQYLVLQVSYKPGLKMKCDYQEFTKWPCP